MTLAPSRLCALLCGSLLLFAPACGDDGGGDDDANDGSSGTEGTEDGTTTDDPPPDEGTTTDEDETEDGETGTDTSEDEDSTGTEGEATEGETDGDTGPMPAGCEEAMDEMTCMEAEGCIWLGNMQNGVCTAEDSGVCEILEMQVCNQHPNCDWDNMAGACNPV